MKSLLLVICAVFFGLFPAIAGFPRETVWIVLGPILLGLTYFTLKRHDWPPPLIPWLFACAATARVVAYWWLNSRHGRSGLLVDEEVWVLGGIAAVSFIYRLYKWIKHQNEIPNSVDPKST